MILHAVGIGECTVSDDQDLVLISYGLGSCIGLLVYDPVVRVAGLLHYMLPSSSLDPGRAAVQPSLFADTGIPLLFHSAYERGANKSRLVVMAVGGAQTMSGNQISIGKQNQFAMRRILERAGVELCIEDTGGFLSRTVRIEVATGRVVLRIPGSREQEMSTNGHAARIRSWV